MSRSRMGGSPPSTNLILQLPQHGDSFSIATTARAPFVRQPNLVGESGEFRYSRALFRGVGICLSRPAYNRLSQAATTRRSQSSCLTNCPVSRSCCVGLSFFVDTTFTNKSYSSSGTAHEYRGKLLSFPCPSAWLVRLSTQVWHASAEHDPILRP